jgi:hypothetical protein
VAVAEGVVAALRIFSEREADWRLVMTAMTRHRARKPVAT